MSKGMETILAAVDGRVKCKQWDTLGGIEICCTPTTIADLKKIRQLSDNDTLDSLIYTIIVKAIDKDGNKMFDVRDKAALQNKIDSDLIADVAQWINSSKGFDQAVKN